MKGEFLLLDYKILRTKFIPVYMIYTTLDKSNCSCEAKN